LHRILPAFSLASLDPVAVISLILAISVAVYEIRRNSSSDAAEEKKERAKHDKQVADSLSSLGTRLSALEQSMLLRLQALEHKDQNYAMAMQTLARVEADVRKLERTFASMDGAEIVKRVRELEEHMQQVLIDMATTAANTDSVRQYIQDIRDALAHLRGQVSARG
jgi:proline dehydrogenase